jgi:hypothetical protein
MGRAIVDDWKLDKKNVVVYLLEWMVSFFHRK